MSETCVECGKRYDPAKSGAKHRGLCSGPCEARLEWEAATVAARHPSPSNVRYHLLRLLCERIQRPDHRAGGAA